MKKCGKFEKRPAAATEQPKLKSVLLQTYFTSLFSLVLCVTLFFGTSYAWFTSEVTNTSNEIYVGTLKVGLHAKGGRDLTSVDNKLFDQNVRWEPGYTTLDTIQISNLGDLAFKYVLSFTDGSLTAGNAENLDAVAKQFDVWVYDHNHENRGAPHATSYADVTEARGWDYAGDLNDLLAGKSVLSGEMASVRDQVEEAQANPGTTDGVATDHTYTIALHLKESAKADIMGSRISLNVKLIAYQMVSEEDVFGKKDYDDIVSVSDKKELTEALATGKNAVMLYNITIGSADKCLTVKNGVLDGNAKTISYTGGKNSNGKTVGVLAASGGTIQNLNVKAGTNGRAIYVTNLDENLEVIGCNLYGEKAFHMEGTLATMHTVTFADTYFDSAVAYNNVMGHAYFNDCTFAQLLTPGGDTTLDGCTFGWENLDVSALESGESITLINCTYKDAKIARAVVKSQDGSVRVEGTDLIVVEDGMIVKK